MKPRPSEPARAVGRARSGVPALGTTPWRSQPAHLHCSSCQRRWRDVPALLPRRDLASAGEWPWLCLDCSSRATVRPGMG
jgi:hypothetical protein